MGDMKSKQQEMSESLSQIEVDANSGDGAVVVKANANNEILNIRIDKNKIALDDVEELEDLILIAINRALVEAGKEQEKASQALMKDMMPPGLGNLFG